MGQGGVKMQQMQTLVRTQGLRREHEHAAEMQSMRAMLTVHNKEPLNDGPVKHIQHSRTITLFDKLMFSLP